MRYKYEKITKAKKENTKNTISLFLPLLDCDRFKSETKFLPGELVPLLKEDDILLNLIAVLMMHVYTEKRVVFALSFGKMKKMIEHVGKFYEIKNKDLSSHNYRNFIRLMTDNFILKTLMKRKIGKTPHLFLLTGSYELSVLKLFFDMGVEDFEKQLEEYKEKYKNTYSEKTYVEINYKNKDFFKKAFVDMKELISYVKENGYLDEIDYIEENNTESNVNLESFIDVEKIKEVNNSRKVNITSSKGV